MRVEDAFCQALFELFAAPGRIIPVHRAHERWSMACTVPIIAKTSFQHHHDAVHNDRIPLLLRHPYDRPVHPDTCHDQQEYEHLNGVDVESRLPSDEDLEGNVDDRSSEDDGAHAAAAMEALRESAYMGPLEAERRHEFIAHDEFNLQVQFLREMLADDDEVNRERNTTSQKVARAATSAAASGVPGQLPSQAAWDKW
ncbi:hypothetical protein VTO73DRAFT_12092 [Trametes versicolor]